MKIQDQVVNNKLHLKKNSTKCSKMTEEGDLLRNGINGASNSLNNSTVVATLNLSKNNNSNNHLHHLHHHHSAAGTDVLSGSLILPSKSKLPTSATSKNDYNNRNGPAGGGGGPSGSLNNSTGCDSSATGSTTGPSGNSGASNMGSPTYGGRLQFFKGEFQ